MALAKSQQSLKKWGEQKWKTSDGKPSKGKKRYLPEAAWNALSPAEKAATNKAKAKGNSKGKQMVKQPKNIAKKTSKFRQGNKVPTGNPGSTLVAELNRLANGGTYPPISSYLDEAAATRAWAERVDVPLGEITDTVGMLNLIYNRQLPRNEWYDYAGACNKIAGTVGLTANAALQSIDANN